jgi:integrase
MAFFRTVKGKAVFVWTNDLGKERSKVIGDASMTTQERWAEVGRLGLDKLASRPDPARTTVAQLSAHYFDVYPFNKQSTKELHQQIINGVVGPKWGDRVAIEIRPKELKAWFLGFEIAPATRAKYRSVMSRLYSFGQQEELLPLGEQYNPCNYVKGREFSQVSSYEALALEPEDALKILAELEQPEYEIALLVATCGLRISEALGLRWRDILWDRRLIAIRQTFVHFHLQEGAKTKLSRSRVEAPQLLLDVLKQWRKETIYAQDDDFVFPSIKLRGSQPRSASMLVEDYLRPAAIRSGVLKEVDGKTYERDGEEVKRFGFHVLGRHSLATLLMDEGENPALVQAVMRHSKFDMTLYYSHSQRKQKRAALDRVAERFAAPQAVQKDLGRELVRELATNTLQ